jgi:hypothetical protein
VQPATLKACAFVSNRLPLAIVLLQSSTARACSHYIEHVGATDGSSSLGRQLQSHTQPARSSRWRCGAHGRAFGEAKSLTSPCATRARSLLLQVLTMHSPPGLHYSLGCAKGLQGNESAFSRLGCTSGCFFHSYKVRNPQNPQIFIPFCARDRGRIASVK